MKNKMQATPDSWGICSVAGSQPKNDDYGLYEASVGACLADGVGAHPMGDAIARYAAHAALDSMKKGRDARTSLRYAQMLVADFTEATDSPSSGASVTVMKRESGRIEVAWLGDVLCLALRRGSSRLESLIAPHRRGRRLTRYVGRKPLSPGHASFPVSPGDKIVLCTDGVWDEMSWPDMQRVLSEAATQEEACARLVLGRRVRDNATALALFVGEDAGRR